MKRAKTYLAVLAAAFVVMGIVAVGWAGGNVMAAAPAQAKARSLPVFELDREWPKVPPDAGNDDDW